MSRFRRLATGNLGPWLSAKTNALVESSAGLNDKSLQIIQALDNQSRLLNRKLEALILGTNNQSRLLDEKLNMVVAGLDNRSRLLDERLKMVVEGLDNRSRLLDERAKAVVAGMDNQSRLLNEKFNAVIAALDNMSRILAPGSPDDAAAPSAAGGGAGPAGAVQAPAMAGAAPIAAGDTPLAPAAELSFEAAKPGGALIAEKTYDTAHPDYDVATVRNYPGKILNDALPCGNKAFLALKQLASGDEVPVGAWSPVLEDALAEAKTVPHAGLVLQRREALQQYMEELESRYYARYIPGWVNLDDALFLYWLVRRLNPRTIVQCGVCNGLSSAFMMLALVKNGDDGRLHLIDIPPVFNPKDLEWTIPGKTYGEVIPEGKTSGWLVPEAYRKRFEVQNGDSKQLLPELVERLPAIDMFYHDSRHTYDHMMFEFRQARRKLAPGGLVVAHDIAWNASLWEFADENRVPAYNFKGAAGVAFF